MYMLLCHTDGSIEHQCITHVCCLARPHLSKVLVWATRLRRQQRSGWRWSTRAATTALMSSNGKVYGATRIKCLLAWHVFQHTVSSPAVPVKHLRIFSDGHCRLVVVHASKLSSKSCLSFWWCCNSLWSQNRRLYGDPCVVLCTQGGGLSTRLS